MRWIDGKKIVRAAGVATLLAAAGAASAEIVVVRATGPSAARFRLGTVLSETQTINLPSPRDELTLLSDTRSWTLKGPGMVPVRGVPAPRVRTQPRLILANGTRERVGAVRGVTGASLERPNLWMVDVAQPGPACLIDPTAIALWREDETAAATTTITNSEGTSTTVDWVAGEETRLWPETLAYAAGGTYRMATTGSAPVAVVLTPLDVAPETVPETAGVLIRLGCNAQLDVLMSQVESAADAAGAEAPAT